MTGTESCSSSLEDGTRTYRAIVSYDGTNYHGWQVQPRDWSVQADIEQAIRTVTGEPLSILGAGRTDAGVHALGQVVSFRLATRIPTERLGDVINARLKGAAMLHRLEEAPDDFHARYDATWRQYRYLIARERSAVIHRFAHVPGDWPDLTLMNQAVESLVGEHSFRALSSAPKEPYNCNVHFARWELWEHGYAFHVRANRFLYRMVRFLVGNCLEIGRGRKAPDHIATLLDSEERRRSAPPAPPQGLFMAAVGYDPAWPEENLPIVPGYGAPRESGVSS